MRLSWDAAPRELLLVGVLELLSAALAAAQLLLGREILIDGFDADAAADVLNDALPALLVLVALASVATLLNTAVHARRAVLGQLIARDALDKVVHRATSVPLAAYDDPDFHDHLQRATAAAEFRPWQLASGILGGLNSISTSAGILFAVLIVEPLIVPLALLAYIPLGLATRRDSAHLLRLAYEFTDEDRERHHLLTVLTERATAAEVRNGDWTAPLGARYRQLHDAHVERQRWLYRRQLQRSMLANAASSVIIAGAIVTLAFLASSGQSVSLADAGVAAVAIAQLGNRMRGISSAGASLYEATLFLEDYFAFVGKDDLPQSGRRAHDVARPRPGRHVVLAQASFTYPGAGTPTLLAIDVDLRPGEIVAVVGPSGAGKSTLVKLIAGLYTPTEGKAYWTDGEQRAALVDESEPSCAVLFQDYAKLELSARVNIAADAIIQDVDDDAVRKATAAAGIEARIDRLPLGFETRLSPAYVDGVDLSEGEWQRVAIARALRSDAPVLILDEPTSSLDARAERRLLDELRSARGDRTVVLVTHRIANASRADRVLVMDGGRIVEDGDPDSLLRSGGIFAEFAELQDVRMGTGPAAE